ncbi:MAG: Holliday junction resolvase RecU [Bacilli bacterium]|nr:Holliday junction resolvase RecU [Bacilli bacterium]MDD4795091.1 Holliday junction resolvase RecU [Bacilli bacterium]
MLYPGNIKKEFNKQINYANRGMDLEALVNEANKFYEINDIAIIYKKPTPVNITKVKYENNKVLTKGQLKSKSSLDYVGVYKGKYLDFDAKSTLSKTSFPLSNISNHQIKHIKNVLKHGGLTFLIIEINNEIYLFKGETLIEFINNNERKSIPYKEIKNNGEKIALKYNPTLDYLNIVNRLYFKGENNEK